MPADLTIVVEGTPIPVYLGDNTELAGARADAAQESAASAADSATEATEAAAIAVAVNGTIYDDVASGLAATTSGNTFTVADGSGSKLAAVYRDDAGVATLLYTIPTVGGVPALGQLQRLMSKLDNATEDANIVFCSNSVANETSEFVYLLTQALADLYPADDVDYRLWNDATPAYDSASSIQTGTGGPTLTTWNASVAGSTPTLLIGDKFNAAFVQPDPDVIFIVHGLNGGDDPLIQVDLLNSLLLRLKAELPDVPVVIVSQNPRSDNETMAPKADAQRSLAARFGHGFIDVHAAFKQAGVPIASLLADALHPNALGSALIRDTILASLLASRAAYGAGAIGRGHMIQSWSSYAELSTWTLNNATQARNTTSGQFETLGHSTSLTNTAGAGGWMYKDILTTEDIVAYRGKYINVMVRQRVPTGNVASSGRIDLDDDGPDASTTLTAITSGVFVTYTATRFIDETCTYLRLYNYASTVATSNTIQIDRISLSVGMVPMDVQAPQESVTRKQRIYGSDSNGVLTLFNLATNGVTARIVDSVTSNPLTAYTAAFDGDGFKMKAAGDTWPKVWIKAGGISMGDGTVTPPLTITMRTATAFGSAAHWYPQTANTYDLGATGVEWRDVKIAGDLYVDTLKVLGARRTGWAVATGTAARTTFATYTAPDISAAYTEAEVQAIADHVQILSQRFKALIDDLHSTAGHGVIGT